MRMALPWLFVLAISTKMFDMLNDRQGQQAEHELNDCPARPLSGPEEALRTECVAHPGEMLALFCTTDVRSDTAQFSFVSRGRELIESHTEQVLVRRLLEAARGQSHRHAMQPNAGHRHVGRDQVRAHSSSPRPSGTEPCAGRTASTCHTAAKEGVRLLA